MRGLTALMRVPGAATATAHCPILSVMLWVVLGLMIFSFMEAALLSAVGNVQSKEWSRDQA
ncbi:hypothetical protein D9M72_481670 [compost metagenome]